MTLISHRRKFIFVHAHKTAGTSLQISLRIPWFYFSRGEACMDYVIRFENLQQGCDEACRRLGLPLQSLPRTHSRLRPAGDDYRDYYTDFSREYVADLRRPMIAAFGYRFDDGL